MAEVQTMFAIETAFPDLKDVKRTLPGRTDGKEFDVHALNIEVMWLALQK